MNGRSGLGSTLARTPLVVKLTSDPVFERSLRWGLTGPDLGAFQAAHGLRIDALRRVRDFSLRHAARVLLPSRAFRDIALAWGLPAGKVEVLPNPVAPPRDLAPRDELRRRLGLAGPTLVYAGRLVPQKALGVALEAVRQTEDVSLLVAGDGPDRRELEGRARALQLDGRVRFLGPQPRRGVFELLKAGDAAVLSSNWENFPHMAIEALAVGTPVVATQVGGVEEILRDGSNGLLVRPGDPEALAAAIQRVLGDETLRGRLRSQAASSVAAFEPEAIYARLLDILVEVAGAA
jgi:glycosyltransferase involved in cell wall biosynthesis